MKNSEVVSVDLISIIKSTVSSDYKYMTNNE